METVKKPLSGELVLLFGLFIMALAVNLYIKAGFGMSGASGVPYVLSQAFTQLTNGTWSVLVQIAWILLLSVVLKKFRFIYVLSFVVSVPFGVMLDAWALVIAGVPVTLIWRCVYLLSAFTLMAIGGTCFYACALPVMPFDLVPREFRRAKKLSIKAVRSGYDTINFILMVSFSLLFIGHIVGVGLATVINILVMGIVIGFLNDRFLKRFDVYPFISWLKPFSDHPNPEPQATQPPAQSA